MSKQLFFVDFNSERFNEYSPTEKEELALAFASSTPDLTVELVREHPWVSVLILKTVIEVGSEFELIPNFEIMAEENNLSLFDTRAYIAYKKHNPEPDIIVSNDHGYYLVGYNSNKLTSKFRIPYSFLREKTTADSEYAEPVELEKFIALPNHVDITTLKSFLKMEESDVRFIIVDMDNTLFYHILKINGYMDSMDGAARVLGQYHNRMVSRRVFYNHHDAFEYAKELSGREPVPHKEYMVTLSNKVRD